MADDGLLVNFSLGDAPLSVAPTFKGGRWRDRVKAKRGLRRWQENVDGNPTATKPSDEVAERPAKRPRVTPDQDRPPNHKANTRGPPREVISSLFTYNPKAKSAPSNPKEELESDITPSNAPLLDGLDTFLTLGLSKPLATHLLTKLNLKAPTSIQKSAITQLVKEDSDAFIQAETGSGKTLAYLLPIVQRIMMLSSEREQEQQNGDAVRVHRDSGLFAVILAPTRELAKQILVVLEGLLQCAHWIVAGTVIGGESKKSEKARVRKGLNILVATPGRLADHLANTKALDVSQVRWLVLDEGDRLMELGFEEEIKDIVAKLEKGSEITSRTIPRLPVRRTTVMCSATMKMNVQRLGDISLKDAVHIKADPTAKEADQSTISPDSGFSAPAQLKQSFIVAPAKQRFVTLCGLLKQTFSRKGSVMKAIIFISCADSVDFHFTALTRNENGDVAESQKSPGLSTIASSPILESSDNPNLTVYKLHGSLPQALRTSTLSSFSRVSNPAVLLCTDVASRGLDLPSIDLVVEYDPAFSSNDHLHRIGRTARAGRNGRATIFLMPGPEESYLEILKKSYRNEAGVRISRQDADGILRRGFAKSEPSSTGATALSSTLKPSKALAHHQSNSSNWQDTATDFQLSLERWVLSDPKLSELARKAYISHVRAYATHVAAERAIFDIKALHLGHLAKAFGLRDKPGRMGRGDSGEGKVKGGKRGPVGAGRKRRSSGGAAGEGGKRGDGRDNHDGDGGGGGGGDDGDDGDGGPVARTADQVDRAEASRKMRAAMKVHMGAANEFNIG